MAETTDANIGSPEHVPCMICGSPSPLYCRKHAHDGDWLIHRCAQCGHGFVQNRPTLEALSKIYATEGSHHPTTDDQDLEAHSADCRSMARVIAKTYVRPGDATGSPAPPRVLDVGSGNGRFSYQMTKLGFQAVMIDLDPRAEAAAKRVPGARFYRTSFEDLPDRGPYDAIIMSQVLEHALDPADWLRRAEGLLTPGGVLAVAVPNFGGIYRVLGERDPFLIPPVHLNYFTAKSLRLAFAAGGLAPRRVDSRSEISAGGKGLGRRVAGYSWNALSWVLNPTRLGR
jgi:SAM-dependent methyltransferase